jgi:hypothetical protein
MGPSVVQNASPRPSHHIDERADLQELHNIVKNMRSNATPPEPDGLNVAFYKSSWSWTGKDVHDLVTSFYNTGNLPTSINTTYIVIIPKNNCPTTLRDFRPISLCNVSFKIVAKSLADRIKNHLPHISHPSQNCFCSW